MAKKAVAVKAVVEGLFQATFQHERDTKNKVRFNEEVEAGKSAVIGSLYLSKTFMPNASRVTVTGSVGDENSETDHDGNTIAFKFRNDTKNKYRFEEVVGEGQAPVIESLYVAKAAIEGEAPEYLVIKIEG